MPIYEYQCTNCQHQFDKIQKISDTPLKKCPECRELALKKLLSAPRFKLAGTGWYETDFKNNNVKSETKEAENKSENKADAKSDTKKESAVEKNTAKKSDVKKED